MTLVGLDTMILIHATKRGKSTDSPEQVDFRRRTLILLDNLRTRNDQIIISTVAITELLKGLKPEHRGPVIAKINSRFRIKPVDVAVAGFAADLWTKHRGLPEKDQMERIVLKVDVFVVAASKIAGASVFYSNDKTCRTLAEQAGMEPKDLPSHSEDLFDDAKIKRGHGESGLEPD